jgi:hypothetical protein
MADGWNWNTLGLTVHGWISMTSIMTHDGVIIAGRWEAGRTSGVCMVFGWNIGWLNG